MVRACGMHLQVLKFCASEHLYSQLQTAHEGVLADTKDSIVTNSNLSRIAYGLELHLVLNPPLK